MRLTPEEHQQITHAFHMAAVGSEQYAQWEKLEDIFTALSHVEEQITPLEIDLRIQLPDEGRVFTGFQEVACISGAVLTDAMGGARCYFLRKILQAMADGWHSLHLLKENRGLLSAKWSACFTPGTALYIQRKMESGDCFVICPEPGITAAAWNYYQAILQSDRVTTKAETMALLEERVQSFLADQG